MVREKRVYLCLFGRGRTDQPREYLHLVFPQSFLFAADAPRAGRDFRQTNRISLEKVEPATLRLFHLLPR
jgi:hypothetical protein